ncbi:aldo/keto reductase [Alkalicoccus chagannorensis]|uniref:aldo/keto reductase n=1 Tax=Alkalicoccus chagannorensis TaxID=427072 RepID=UPI00042A13F4|nr:aldo/keto reductase [Alkalicoccus chagannorensis]
MKQNQLGSSQLMVSEIGFGCMSLSGEKDADTKLIHEALDEGINFFDTADLYQYGRNEEIVGSALRDRRHQAVIATKGGNEFGQGIDGWRWNASKEYIKEACRRSLKRMGLDYIDLYQLHGGTIEDDWDDVFEALDELQQEGLIRCYGMSSIRPNVIKRFSGNPGVVSNLMQYSLLDRRAAEFMPLLDEHGISLISRGPVAKGLLTGSWENKLSDDGYLAYSSEELSTVLPELEKLAAEAGMSLSSLALRFILDQENPASAIQGARTSEQLQINVQAARAERLNEDVMDALKHVTKATTFENHR